VHSVDGRLVVCDTRCEAVRVFTCWSCRRLRPPSWRRCCSTAKRWCASGRLS
jgi:hypothetical protein